MRSRERLVFQQGFFLETSQAVRKAFVVHGCFGRVMLVVTHFSAPFQHVYGRMCEPPTAKIAATIYCSVGRHNIMYALPDGLQVFPALLVLETVVSTGCPGLVHAAALSDPWEQV